MADTEIATPEPTETQAPLIETMTPLPADAGVPDGEITTQAADELARLAARNGNDDDVMAGLASEPSAEQAGGRKSKAAKGKAAASPGAGAKAPFKTVKEKEKEKTRAATAKEKEKAKKEAAKEKAKAAAEKKKEKDAEARAKKKEREEARKAELEARRKQVAAERAAKRTPDLLKKETQAVRDAFALDYALAGPKTDRNADGIGIRRAKADRGDFCAGYIMCLRRMRADAKRGAAGATS